MRVMFSGEDALGKRLVPIAERFALAWSLTPADERPRVLIAVSATSHRLNGLLYRWWIGAPPVEPFGLVSNHETLRGLAEWHGVPFHHLPVTSATRRQQEARLLDVFRDTRADLLVRARYMQVLSPTLVGTLATRRINIHYSFLPSFKGTLPHHQARARGVALIGAAAHFVTSDLDEGPVIEQAAERIDQRDLGRAGHRLPRHRGSGAGVRRQVDRRGRVLPTDRSS